MRGVAERCSAGAMANVWTPLLARGVCMVCAAGVRYGGILDDDTANIVVPMIDVATASAVDACSARMDSLHKELGALLLTVSRCHGSGATDASWYGMHALTAFRCVDGPLRSYLYFSRKKLFAGKLLKWAESATKKMDLEPKKRVRCRVGVIGASVAL